MVVTHRGYVSAEQIAAEIERARQKLGPEVVRFRHSIGPNHYDEPASTSESCSRMRPA